MPSSYSRVVLHTVFSTKYRKPLITPDIEPDLLRFMSKVLIAEGCKVIEINCVPDHVHIVHTLPRTVSIANLLERLKSKTTKMVHRAFPRLRGRFYWQTGYATFSADYRHLKDLREYVRNQKVHHGYEEFYREFLKLLNAFELEYDPKYLFPEEPD